MQIFAPELLDKVFDSTLSHLLHGEFDVDPNAIGFEATTIKGKAYTYFGIFPRAAAVIGVAVYRSCPSPSRPAVLPGGHGHFRCATIADSPCCPRQPASCEPETRVSRRYGGRHRPQRPANLPAGIC